MSEVRIVAEPRTEFGKGGARRTRRAGKIPAVLYGHGSEPRHISLPDREFEHALRTEAGLNVLLTLDLDGGSELALPKAIQRDPLRGVIEHADLILVRRGEKVTIEVPVQVTGEIAPGGLLDQQLMTLSVVAEATHIPQNFQVDVSGAEVGHAVHAGDVELPSGTELQTDPEATVVHVLAAPTAEQIEAELAGAEAELGAGAAGAEEAAPAEEEAAAAPEVTPGAEASEGGSAEAPQE